jgi:O-methyltransferase involved in polyketide biosynthesis
VDELARTSLIPFWARADDAARMQPILHDAGALSLAPIIEARYGRSEVANPVRVGCCLRNWLTDRWITRLAASADGLTVVTVGCGLDTRPRRLNHLGCSYIEIDDVAVVSVRDELMRGTRAIRLVGDGLDLDLWTASVHPGARVVVVCEGVLVYHEPGRVQSFLDDLAHRFPRAFLIFDSLSPAALRRGNAPRIRGDRPTYRWSAGRTCEISAGGTSLQVLENKGFLDLPYRFTRQFGLGGQLAHSLPPWRRAYRMTLARVGSNA